MKNKLFVKKVHFSTASVELIFSTTETVKSTDARWNE